MFSGPPLKDSDDGLFLINCLLKNLQPVSIICVTNCRAGAFNYQQEAAPAYSSVIWPELD
jgi:hypothetical protein